LKGLYDHITHNNILDENQFGFRPNSSTEKASFKLIEEILNSMNNKHSTGGIFYDLQKAFDCVSHDILITKVPMKGANIILYADDTSIIVNDSEYNGYKSIMSKTFYEVNKWFKSNLLTLNLKKNLPFAVCTNES
jgi:hypothetical protein